MTIELPRPEAWFAAAASDELTAERAISRPAVAEAKPWLREGRWAWGPSSLFPATPPRKTAGHHSPGHRMRSVSAARSLGRGAMSRAFCNSSSRISVFDRCIDDMAAFRAAA